MADTRRLGTLKRIARVRAVERIRAREALASAHSEHRRLADLHERSKAMLGDGRAMGRPVSAECLAQSFRFSAGVTQLARSARKLSQEANQRSATASKDAAAADHRLNHVTSLIDATQRDLRNRETALAGQTGQLARGLHKESSMHSQSRPKKSATGGSL